MSTDTSVQRCLVATWPCGCIGAVTMLSYLSPSEQAQFFKEQTEDGALVENVTMDDYRARGGIVDCKHDPKWGGVEERYGHCPRCQKRVAKKKRGDGFVAHKMFAGVTCPQEPWS